MGPMDMSLDELGSHYRQADNRNNGALPFLPNNAILPGMPAMPSPFAPSVLPGVPAGNCSYTAVHLDRSLDEMQQENVAPMNRDSSRMKQKFDKGLDFATNGIKGKGKSRFWNVPADVSGKKGKGMKGKGNNDDGNAQRRSRCSTDEENVAKRCKRLESAQDPRDIGNLPPHLIALSRDLAHFLRHCAGKQGYAKVSPEGWIAVRVLRTMWFKNFREVSEEDLMTVARESFSKDQPRFQTRLNDREREIRATHRHSFNVTILQDDTVERFPVPSPRYEKPCKGSRRNTASTRTTAASMDSDFPDVDMIKVEQRRSVPRVPLKKFPPPKVGLVAQAVMSSDEEMLDSVDEVGPIPAVGTRMVSKGDFDETNNADHEDDTYIKCKTGQAFSFLSGDGVWSEVITVHIAENGKEVMGKQGYIPAAFLAASKHKPPPKVPPPRLKKTKAKAAPPQMPKVEISQAEPTG